MAIPFHERLKTEALRLGFDLVGIAPAQPADGFDKLGAWLAAGFAGEMSYLHRHEKARAHPCSILPEVRSVVMLGLNYQPSDFPAHGIARYALGPDYHDVIWAKLDQLLAWVRAEKPGALGRGVVDTAPLLERDFARRAGLGWFGKNTMLLHKKNGSYFFLAALLLDLDLPTDPPFEHRHCGACTACLAACPTDAFVAPYQLDARKCISYLTIELRGSIPIELRPGMGDWLFGCDICQEVCPWNRKAPIGNLPQIPELMHADPLELVTLSDAEFRRRFRGTALWRTKRQGLVRNAAIVLGNVGDERAIAVLETMSNDDDLVVREAVLWALEKVRDRVQSPLHQPDA